MLDQVLADAPGAQLFPPLGRVRVKVVPLSIEAGRALVRVSSTQTIVTVNSADLTSDQGCDWAPGQLLERVSEPGQYFNKRYSGSVLIGRRKVLVPVGNSACSRNIIAA